MKLGLRRTVFFILHVGVQNLQPLHCDVEILYIEISMLGFVPQPNLQNCKVFCFSLAPLERPVCSIKYELMYLAPQERPVYFICQANMRNLVVLLKTYLRSLLWSFFWCLNFISTNRSPLWGYIRSSPAGVGLAFIHKKIIITLSCYRLHTYANTTLKTA